MMFQSYALFPHMSVEQNVMYGLRMDGAGKDEARGRAGELLELVQLPKIGSRRPAQLSGGQRQRVALARALARSPRVLLLDEPLSALDRQMRGDMQIELKRLQHQLGITFVVVTHDQEEALTMADRIAVMREGRVEQVGTPSDLYEAPATRFVAGFLGEANLFAGEVQDSGVGPWRVDGEQLRRHELVAGDEAFVVVRPEDVQIAPAGSGDLADVANLIEGTIAEVAYLGTTRKYVIDLADGATVQARVGSVSTAHRSPPATASRSAGSSRTARSSSVRRAPPRSRPANRLDALDLIRYNDVLMNTSKTRKYRMEGRAASAAATRERIVEAAQARFMSDYYDEVTLRRIAADAGVALQTVVNHFSNKDGLFAAVADRLRDQVESELDEVPAGDTSGAVTALMDRYERAGDATVRALAVEDRVAALRPLLADGREHMRTWVERTFGPALDGTTGGGVSAGSWHSSWPATSSPGCS